jgi:hypothetical protein
MPDMSDYTPYAERRKHLQEKMRACALKNAAAGQAASLWQKAGTLPKGIDAGALDAWWQQGPSSGRRTVARACIAWKSG